jgi:hypothetical protein
MTRKWRLALIYSITAILVVALALFAMSMWILLNFRSQ